MIKKHIGLITGLCAGVIDVIPMLLQKLPISADLSAFFTWVIIGFFISKINIGINGALKGLIIALLTITPVAIIIAANEPFTLIPILIMTVLLGSLSGYFIEKFS